MAKAKSETRDVPTITSWSDADAAGREVVELQTQIDKAAAKLKADTAALKERQKAAIQEPQAELKAKLGAIEEFTESHKTELHGKSRKLTHVTVGYRSNPPSVVARLKSFAKVLERLLGLGDKAEAYVIRKPDIDKQRILADYKAGKLTSAQLTELGVKIEQKETFFCEAVEAQVAEADATA